MAFNFLRRFRQTPNPMPASMEVAIAPYSISDDGILSDEEVEEIMGEPVFDHIDSVTELELALIEAGYNYVKSTHRWIGNTCMNTQHWVHQNLARNWEYSFDHPYDSDEVEHWSDT